MPLLIFLWSDQAEFVDQVTGGHDFNLDDIVVGAGVTAHRILRYTRLRPIRAGATVGPEKQKRLEDESSSLVWGAAA